MNMYRHDLFIAIYYMIDEEDYGGSADKQVYSFLLLKVLFVVLLHFGSLSNLTYKVTSRHEKPKT